MSSLRAQRRQRTTNTIRKVAVDLAYEHGLDGITVEMISAAAGVSPRTFFNYFSFRDAALTPPDLAFSEVEIARFAAAEGKLTDDLLTLLTPVFAALGDDRETLQKCHMLALDAPKLLAHANSVYLKFDKTIAEVLARRLKTSFGDPDTGHLAALITATIKCGLGIWVMSGQGSAAGNVRKRLVAMPQLASAFIV